jgi:hypothetical protein
MKRDEGSVLVLAIGFMVLVILTATTAVDIASMWVTRSALDAMSDGAALAGAQAIDVSRVYAVGVGDRLRIDPAGARSRVHAYVAAARLQAPDVSIVAIEVRDTSVKVTLKAPSRLPFGYLLAGESTLVRSAARGVNDVR